ncbi:4'-phosphopantetheinyl transferase family protein [Staphylococcus saprophyticus]
MYSTKKKKKKGFFLFFFKKKFFLKKKKKKKIKKKKKGKKKKIFPLNIFFSLSYSTNIIALAINNSPVGIDIEKIFDLDYMSVVNNFFNSNEKRYMSNLVQDKHLNCFFNMWTLKESLGKFIGTGILTDDFLSHFDTLTLDNPLSFSQSYNTFFKTTKLKNSIVMSLCSRENVNYDIKIINQRKVLNFFKY